MENRSIRIKQIMSKIRGIYELPSIVIYSGKDLETAEKYWVNDQELTVEAFEKMLELCPAGSTIVFLPAKNASVE